MNPNLPRQVERDNPPVFLHKVEHPHDCRQRPYYTDCGRGSLWKCPCGQIWKRTWIFPLGWRRWRGDERI